MINVLIKALDKEIEIERVLGSVSGNTKLPTVIFIGGIHGNETSGVYALRKVLATIKQEDIPILGNIYALSGNLIALQKGVRYTKEDLNRIWTHSNIEKINNTSLNGYSKDLNELIELYTIIKDIINTNKGPFYFIDLHTTSSQTSPFITISDSINNRKFSSNFPVPIILGIEEYLDGTLLSFINEFGHISLGFEAGQHYEKDSILNCEAFIWLALVYSGCAKKKEVLNYNHYKSLLTENFNLKNQFFEIDYRFEIKKEDDFKMIDGFLNFDKINKNQPLAKNLNSIVKAPFKGRIFMPLYQNKGDDGFFVVTKISMFWLILSKYFRKLHLHHLLRTLPGIRQDRNDKHTLIVNHKTAKFLATEIFHFFGYRKKVLQNEKWVITKRDRKIRSLN